MYKKRFLCTWLSKWLFREWNLEKTLRDALRDITSFVFEILLIKYVFLYLRITNGYYKYILRASTRVFLNFTL